MYIISKHRMFSDLLTDLQVNSVAFSQDFQILVTGSDDQRVRIFNAKTAQFICKLKGHEGMTGHRNEYVCVSV